MKVTHIRIRKADGPLTVMDAFVDKGLTEGGHASLPDIDVDYASDRRQEIKDYLEERYNADGRQRVFSAGTFTTMKLKAALKDVARVHRVPHSIVNYITAMIDDGTDCSDRLPSTENFGTLSRPIRWSSRTCKDCSDSPKRPPYTPRPSLSHRTRGTAGPPNASISCRSVRLTGHL